MCRSPLNALHLLLTLWDDTYGCHQMLRKCATHNMNDSCAGVRKKRKKKQFPLLRELAKSSRDSVHTTNRVSQDWFWKVPFVCSAAPYCMFLSVSLHVPCCEKSVEVLLVGLGGFMMPISKTTKTTFVAKLELGRCIASWAVYGHLKDPSVCFFSWNPSVFLPNGTFPLGLLCSSHTFLHPWRYRVSVLNWTNGFS